MTRFDAFSGLPLLRARVYAVIPEKRHDASCVIARRSKENCTALWQGSGRRGTRRFAAAIIAPLGPRLTSLPPVTVPTLAQNQIDALAFNDDGHKRKGDSGLMRTRRLLSRTRLSVCRRFFSNTD